ncbi:MAG: class II glutamine amidotransferase [Elusimicrobiota bacterium]
MCELLGISSNAQVDIEFSFKEWQRRGRRNSDGYGFAYWKGAEPKIIKDATSLDRAKPDTIDYVRSVRSKMFVCHVRMASMGLPNQSNTHPFKARLGEKDMVFAHNGTLRSPESLQLRDHRPAGKTDSERAFLWLLEQLSETPEAQFAQALKAAADDLRSRDTGSFNFLLSDGGTLWARADTSLWFIERKPPYGGQLVNLKDAGYCISLAHVKRPDERAVLVATRPLSDEPGWKQLKRGELLWVRDGSVRRFSE